jgi:glutamyl-tRNA reductase
MNFQVIGLNYKSAPISIRERISFSSGKLYDALIALKGYVAIEEAVILSTCNRTEFYAVTADAQSGHQAAQDFLADFHKAPIRFFRNHLYVYNDEEALRHLFRVAASLDSMVIGETQILGQVKEAYSKAVEAKSAGKALSRFFEEAIRLGKKVHSETKIGRGAVSVSSVAIRLSKEALGTLKDKKVLIIGSGKIAELAVRDLYSQGIRTVVVANRTFAKAKELASRFRGTAINLKEIIPCLSRADIVISSTSAPHFLITYPRMQEVMQLRNHRPLFLIDLGLPRNISPEVKEIENSHLYNLDDLTSVCDANLKERLREAAKAEQIIQRRLKAAAQELLQFKKESLVESRV